MRAQGGSVGLPTGAGTRDPVTVLLGHSRDAFRYFAVDLDQLAHDVVERRQRIGLRRARPGEKGQHVVPRARLRFGGAGQQ